MRQSCEVTYTLWQAVSNRDRSYDGKFVYAALTTSIYCRPSCPARHPHRRNTLIFPTPVDAERQGFIPCRRCHPSTNALSPAERGVKSAIDHIKQHFDQSITLAALARVSGVSPNHLQQSFKRIIGLSPKVFCDAQRLSYLKELLRRGRSVSSAGYEAGYGSSRALYEKATKSLGMSPATYQRGGEGIVIRFATMPTDWGRTLVAGTADGICAVQLGKNEKSLTAELRAEFPKAFMTRERSPNVKWVLAVHTCQSKDPLLSMLSIETRLEVFRTKVWKILQ